MHWLYECTKLAAAEYLKRYNNALLILCVALGMQEELLGKNTKWYKEKLSYAGTSNIACVKQQQQDDQM